VEEIRAVGVVLDKRLRDDGHAALDVQAVPAVVAKGQVVEGARDALGAAAHQLEAVAGAPLNGDVLKSWRAPFHSKAVLSAGLIVELASTQDGDALDDVGLVAGEVADQ